MYTEGLPICIDFSSSFIKILRQTDIADENIVIISCKKMAFDILLSEPFENASRALLIKIKSPPLVAGTYIIYHYFFFGLNYLCIYFENVL